MCFLVGSASQWPKWLRRQYGKLDIYGSSPGYDTNFSLKNYHTSVCFCLGQYIHEDLPIMYFNFCCFILRHNWKLLSITTFLYSLPMFRIFLSFLILLWTRWLKRQGAWPRAGRPGFNPRYRRGEDFSTLLRVQTGPGVRSTSFKMNTGRFTLE